jgi:predicted O-linked N-acetylglucosamine transferase (SPINDLY family)
MPNLLDASVSCLTSGEIQSSEFYESAIFADETSISNYWYLGISYLLAGREEDAQAAWFMPLSEASPTEIDSLTDELLAVLEQAAQDRTKLTDLEQAWLIRQHLWTLSPDRLENILELVVLAHKLGKLTSDVLIDWQVSDLLAIATVGSIDESLLERVMRGLIDLHTELSIKIIGLCIELTSTNRDLIIGKTTTTAFKLFYQDNILPFAVKLAETCNRIRPDNLGNLQILVGFYSAINSYAEAIKTAEQHYRLAPTIVDRLSGSYLIQQAHFTAGSWDNAPAIIERHRQLLTELIQVSPQNLSYWQNQVMLVCSFFLPYTEDNPRVDKLLQNQLAAIYQQNITPTTVAPGLTELTLQKKTNCLRIGYIGSTLKIHSVGWLSRWLIHHHDRSSFQTFIYAININRDDKFNQQWFRDKVNVTYYCEGNPQEVVAQIQADEIDILIELDSLTFDFTCYVMACKPAPIQISWLGWDSSGIPTVDYFIADPYVLPDDAQEYYQEKIWRLPQTYLAVDGFEVGVPTLRREDLDIPADAVIYLSSQSGYKRHPENIRSQMQILKAVPNSYFLIKGKSDAETIQNFFGKLAAEVGISLDRFRFLDRDVDEYTHRANLAIADIVLDTFPYNGATTTLETLWMGIPMVTRVGSQFAARNSYTFMLNAGIEEGIAWSEQEYIDWGIKLGLDRQLRDKIQGKLRSGKNTAPVWDAKQFTLDLEQAYRQMWAKYQEEQSKREVVTEVTAQIEHRSDNN